MVDIYIFLNYLAESNTSREATEKNKSTSCKFSGVSNTSPMKKKKCFIFWSVSYRQQVQAILIQVFYHGRQVSTLPFGKSVFVVRQVLNIGPNIIVWGPQGPEKTQRETVSPEHALQHDRWKTHSNTVAMETTVESKLSKHPKLLISKGLKEGSKWVSN